MTRPPDHPLRLAIDGTPPSLNAIPDVGAPLRAAAEPIRAAFASQLPDDSPLRDVSSLQVSASIAFADRRHRAAHNFEPVLRCALEGALQDAGWGARDVELHLQLRGGAARPGTTIDVARAAE